MGLLEKTRPYQRHAFGSHWHKNICKLSFGYTHTYHEVAAGAAAAIHAAITSSFSAQTITTSITDPDVPRVLAVTPGGTDTDIGNGVITITGTNVEGATITDTFQLVDADTTQIVGTKAFKTVTSIAVPACEGTAATFTIDTTNRLGLNHRLFPNNTTVKVVYSTAIGTVDNGTLDTAPTVNDWDETYVEKNFITPATTPDGTYTYTIYYIYDNWGLFNVNDEPSWLTTTSTSSTSTSTTTSTFTTSTSSTSTSSTSSSTSSTSTSTSSTSSSTSTSSTSTSTVP